MKDVKNYISEQLQRIAEIKYSIEEEPLSEYRMISLFYKCRGVHELAGVRYMRLLDSDERLDYLELLDMVYDEILE